MLNQRIFRKKVFILIARCQHISKVLMICSRMLVNQNEVNTYFPDWFPRFREPRSDVNRKWGCLASLWIAVFHWKEKQLYFDACAMNYLRSWRPIKILCADFKACALKIIIINLYNVFFTQRMCGNFFRLPEKSFFLWCSKRN